MPGPAHGGVFFTEQWTPGAGVAGTTQDTKVGDFGQDMILIGIELDCAIDGSLNSRAKLEMSNPLGRAKYEVFPYMYTCSNRFNAQLASYVRDMGVLVLAGERIKFKVRHTGTDNLKWLFSWAPPPIDDKDLAIVLGDVLREGGAIPEHIRARRPQ